MSGCGLILGNNKMCNGANYCEQCSTRYIAELEERLEISHVYRYDGITGGTIRKDTSAEEKEWMLGSTDGIACRDATIKIQDEQIDRLKKEMSRLMEFEWKYKDLCK